MNDGNKSKKNKRSQLSGIIALILVITIAVIGLMRIELFRRFFGFGGIPTFKFQNFLYTTLGVIGAIIACAAFIFSLIFVYKILPLEGELIAPGILLQKKKFLPSYWVTVLVKVKGLPRATIKNTQSKDSNDELFYQTSWDVVSSLAQGSGEYTFWIVKHKNIVQIIFSISGWAWLSKERAISRAKQGLLSLKASFNNLYSSILFEKLNKQDSHNFLVVLDECKYGLEARGIPAQKQRQAQIDRIINTFNTINENCFFVVSLKGVKKGREKRQVIGRFASNSVREEFENDFKDSKKTGQSKVGIYAFARSENGMHTLLAAVLSIWSGTYTFKASKLGECSNKRIYKAIRSLNPNKAIKLSNKAISSLIHLPEKSFVTRDTGQPTFEIPSLKRVRTKYEIIIGNIVQNDRMLDEFSIPLENFHYNVEIIGMIGRGKSFLGKTIIEQILNIELGCLIFDLKGEYAKLFVDDPNVLVYTIGQVAPLGINLFQMNSDDDVQNVLSLICEMLTIVGTPFSPTMLNIFETALQKVAKKKEQNLKEFMYCLYESSNEYTENMKTSYARDSIDAILNRLNFIFGGVNYEVFSALNNTIGFQDLDFGKKIIIDFSEYLRRGASTASLFLVCNLVLHLLSRHASRRGITNKLRYLVILEEAMYLIPKRFDLQSSASICYSEQNFIIGRSLGIGTISIYQSWDSVSPLVHANSLTKILFRSENIDKIQLVVPLSEEQFNYLPHLPDRHFIMKSKSLSGPALLKTKTFNRVPLPKEEYLEIARKKFKENGLIFERITESLADLRKIVFGQKSKRTPIDPSRDFSKRDSIQGNIEHKKVPVHTATNKRKTKTFQFNKQSWERCITSCPARIIHKDKHSNWIKENICENFQKKSQKIAEELISKEYFSPLITRTEKAPIHLVNEILNYLIDSKIRNPEIITFCTMNLILNKIRKTFGHDHSWKNRYLNVIRNHLLERAILDYTHS